jgi:hypothetical protein
MSNLRRRWWDHLHNRAYGNHRSSGMTDTATQDTRSAHNAENQDQETTPTVGDRPSRRQYKVAPWWTHMRNAFNEALEGQEYQTAREMWWWQRPRQRRDDEKGWTRARTEIFYEGCTNGKDGMTTTRTDGNAHYYYFTERLPHMNLTRVRTSVCDERQPP